MRLMPYRHGIMGTHKFERLHLVEADLFIFGKDVTRPDLRTGNVVVMIALQQHDIFTNDPLPENLDIILPAKRPVPAMNQQIVFPDHCIDPIHNGIVHIVNPREYAAA